MEPEKKKRLIRIVAQVVIIAIGIFEIYTYSLAAKHSTIETFSFCFSLLLIIAVLVQIIINTRRR